MADRHATVVWEGTLPKGTGTINSGSGVLKDAPVTWASRIERADGKTSPEELLAAAHAECFAMVLANTFSTAGNTPTRLEVTATCTVNQQDGGLKITTMRLDVRGDVPGVDGESFSRIATEAEGSCPVSNALRGNVEISVNAELLSEVSA